MSQSECYNRKRGVGKCYSKYFLIYPSPTVVSLANRSPTTVTSTLGEVVYFVNELLDTYNSEDNNNLGSKNLIKVNLGDSSLNAQNDVNSCYL